jgi:hypothetical protein
MPSRIGIIERATVSRICLYGTDTFTFPANTPFYIQHGWGEIRRSDRSGLDFKLFIDGVQRNHDANYLTLGAGGPICYPYIHSASPPRIRGSFPPLHWYFLWVFRFPNGLPAGDYVFRREYYIRCQIALDMDIGAVSECSDPNEILLLGSFEKTGQFLGSFTTHLV